MFKILISVALFDFNIQELEKILIQIIKIIQVNRSYKKRFLALTHNVDLHEN